MLNKIYFANLSQLELIEIAKKKVQIKEKRVNLKQREFNCLAMIDNIESLAAMEKGYLGLNHIAKQEADIELEELELNTAPLHFFGLA